MRRASAKSSVAAASSLKARSTSGAAEPAAAIRCGGAAFTPSSPSGVPEFQRFERRVRQLGRSSGAGSAALGAAAASADWMAPSCGRCAACSAPCAAIASPCAFRSFWREPRLLLQLVAHRARLGDDSLAGRGAVSVERRRDRPVVVGVDRRAQRFVGGGSPRRTRRARRLLVERSALVLRLRLRARAGVGGVDERHGGPYRLRLAPLRLRLTPSR